MKARILLLCTLFLQPGLAAALDEEPVDYTVPGFYLGLTGNAHLENFESPGKWGIDVGTSAGGTLRIGYRFNANLGVEVLAEYLNNFADMRRIPGAANALPLDKADGVWGGLNFRGYLPFGRFQPYAIIGAGILHARVPGKADNRESLAFRLGGGIDVWITDWFGLMAEGVYVQATWNSLERVGFGSVGGGIQLRMPRRDSE